MARRTSQPHSLRLVTWEAGGPHLVLHVQMVQTRPGRPDLDIGLPMRLFVPDALLEDDDVCDLGNTIHQRLQRQRHADEVRRLEEEHPTLFADVPGTDPS